ncbi:MAG TPA: choice-of-anchor J domain-containing protein [Catalimonadaceae bacterium]|nr:choice-of-anchor J domain-containing protein [Catalimonadaceae bacterium]
MRTQIFTLKILFSVFAVFTLNLSWGQVFYTENFNGNTPPPSWTITDQGTGACQWMVHKPFTNEDFVDINMLGSNFLFVNCDSAGDGTIADETISTPVIQTNGASQVFLRFDHFIRIVGTFRLDTGVVEVFNGTNWIAVERFDQTEGTGTAPVKVSINVSAHLNPNFKFRFRYVGDWGYYWAVDNVELFTPPANDAGVSSIQKPQNVCGLTTPFIVKSMIRNYGSAAQTNIPVSYKVNNLPVVTETFTGNLAAGDSVLYSFNTPFISTNQGNYSFSSWTQLASDQTASNDSVRNVLIVKNASLMAPVTFVGIAGNNLPQVAPGWSEANGLLPTGTTAAWNAPAAAQTVAGYNPIRVNISGNNRKEWILSPALNIQTGAAVRFKMAVTNHNSLAIDSLGSDDSLVVKVTTNCGQSWTSVKSFTIDDDLSNQFSSFLVSLNDYAGQNIRIGFYATSGSVNNTNDFNFLLDKIEVLVPSPTDLALTGFGIPSANCGLGSTLVLKVNVFNNGTVAQSSIPVSYSVNGQAAVSETFSGTTLNPGESATYTFSTPLSFPNPGTYQITAWSALPGDVNFSNDTAKTLPLTRSSNSFAMQAFTNFDGTNLSTSSPGWDEATGLNGQTSGASAWNLNATSQQTSLGSKTAKINLYTTGKQDWILTPNINVTAGYVLRFKTALTNWGGPEIDSMGTDDSLIVKISTNCGQSWIHSLHITKDNQATNSFRSHIVPLDAYVGQNILIGFYATEGSVDDDNDYDVHIDNVEILIPSPTDVGVSGIIVPTGECGSPALLPVKVQLYNNGGQTQTSVPVSYSLNGQAAVSQTFSVSLAPGGFEEVTFQNPVAIAIGSNNSISAWTSLTGDLNIINDSTTKVTFSRSAAQFPTNTFTGFTGTNLSTVFPGWKEQTGNIPTGTTSTWANSSAGQTTALGSQTARINLFGTTRREWLVSPAFNPDPAMVLKFKVAVTNLGTAAADSMGSDDSVHVMSSSDCGQTWRKLKSFTRENNLSNTLTSFTVPLNASAGEPLRIAFYASDGNVDNAFDYDFHVDEVEVVIPQPKDLGVSAQALPNTSCSAPSTFNLKISVTNFGSEAQTGFPVGFRVKELAPVIETFTGTIQPGQTSEYTFAASIDLSAGGSFAIRSWTSLPLDVATSNDTIYGQVVTPSLSLNSVSFSGFDGQNLSDLFAGWGEQAGSVPTGQTSLWYNSTPTQATNLGSATARMAYSTNTKREWIMSPVFLTAANSHVSFRLAVTERNFTISDAMGSDDSLNVMISTDCGQTWTRVRAFTAASGLTNVLTEYSVDLSSFAGQSCRVAFYGTEGTVDNVNDFDMHLDDVKVDVVSGVQSLAIQDVQIYPNPSTGHFFIRSGEIRNDARVQLSGMDGRVWNITAQYKGEGILELNTGSLPAGLYRIQVQMAESVIQSSVLIR